MDSAYSFAVNKKVLLIFAKQPRAGETKTRLCPPLTATEAADIYAAMLQDVLNLTAKMADLERWLCYSPADSSALAYFSALAPELHCLPQNGADLGERMYSAFTAAFAAGATRVVIIGTDSPDLPTTFIDQAFAQLESATGEIIFGPSGDGGYYLLGARKVWPELFSNIPWSTAEVLTASLRNASAAGCSTTLLPEWGDIDTIHDLRRLATSPGESAPLTRQFIANLRLAF